MIIFGLGNPGAQYRTTRHNVGYLLVNRCARLYRKKFRRRRDYKIATIKINKKTVHLIKLMCWMNQSGVVVAKVLREMPQDFLIVVDDINLPLGKIRMRSSGSDGGHLGLRSIIHTLENFDFPRLRIGIGHPQEEVTNYVLSPFKSREKKIVNAVIEEGIRGIKILIKSGFERALNYINTIDLAVKFETRNPKP